MSYPLTTDRKPCPNCGHSNRVTAKNCTQCGFAFFLADTGGMLRKRCAHCGFFNRMGAKICTRCGAAFRGTVMESRSQRQKWCPQCGAPRKAGAKVCNQCGYRFKAEPVEPPLVQSNDLGVPIKVKPPEPPVKVTPRVTPTASEPPAQPASPKPTDLSGEPAPYLSPEELERLRQMGTDRRDVFVRLFKSLRETKRKFPNTVEHRSNTLTGTKTRP